MRSAIARLAFPALLLTLSGCFRPAGEAIQPTAITAPTSIPTQIRAEVTAELNMTAATGIPVTVSAGGTPSVTFPPITVVQPTPAAPVDTQDPFAVNAGTPGGTPTFITPRPPLGPLGTALPTATPSGGAFTATPSGLITPTDPSAQSADGCSYTVQPGDSLFGIAFDRDLTVEEVRAVNPQLVGDPPILDIGEVINIPGCNATSQPVDTSVTAVETPPGATIPGSQTYTVQSGDILVNIAARFDVTVEAIVQANNLTDPDDLDVGQVLVIPPAEAE